MDIPTKPPIVVGTGATEAGSWELLHYPEATHGRRTLGIRDPEGTSTSQQSFQGDMPFHVWRAYFDGPSRATRPSLVLGHARYDVASIRLEHSGVQVPAQLFSLPGDDEYRAFVVPVDDPPAGLLVAYRSDGTQVLKMRLVDPAAELSLSRSQLLIDRGSGRLIDGSSWALRATLQGDTLLTSFELPGTAGTAIRAKGRFPVLDGPGPQIEMTEHYLTPEGAHAGWGQVTKRSARLLPCTTDGSTAQVQQLPAPDLPVDLFVVSAHVPSWIVSIQADDESGKPIETSTEWSAPRGFEKARSRLAS